MSRATSERTIGRRGSALGVLFDRDGLLIVGANDGDPSRIVVAAGARQALDRLRAERIAVGLVSRYEGRGLMIRHRARMVTLRAEELLNVETWPNDVPCKILKKHPDGTYEITVGWTRFFQTHAPGTKYWNTPETSYWDQKCKG